MVAEVVASFQIAGAKTLVLDAKIAGTLGLIAEMSLLRVCGPRLVYGSLIQADFAPQEHGVEQIYWLEPGALSQAQKHIVYVCRPELSLMRIIAGECRQFFPILIATAPHSPRTIKSGPH